MVRQFYVYEHVFPNNKRYIGITCQDPHVRWDYGWGYKENIQPMMYRAIQKYGWNNIQHNILYDHLTEAEAKQKEQELILFYHTCIYDPLCNGYNMTYGGEGALKYTTEEAREEALHRSMHNSSFRNREKKNMKQREYYQKNKSVILEKQRLKRAEDKKYKVAYSPLTREEKLLKHREQERKRLLGMTIEQKENLKQKKREYYYKNSQTIKDNNRKRYFKYKEQGLTQTDEYKQRRQIAWKKYYQKHKVELAQRRKLKKKEEAKGE